MTVSDGDIVQAVVTFETTDGYQLQNKYCYKADFASDQSDASVISAIAGQLGTLYDELAAEIPSMLDDPVVDIDLLTWVTDHWEVLASIGSAVVATTLTNGSELLPLTTCALMAARTARPRSRGRKSMPVFGEDRQSGGGLISAAVTALGNALLEYLATITISSGNDLEPGVPSTVTGTFLPFISGLTRVVLGTQRRRRQGYGV